MPAESARQYGLMQASCHGQSSAVPKDVACEFVHKTSAKKRSAFAKHLRKRRKSGR